MVNPESFGEKDDKNSKDFHANAAPRKESCKGRFTRYDFVACDKFTTGLRHELFHVNQTYNSLTTVVYVKLIVVGF